MLEIGGIGHQIRSWPFRCRFGAGLGMLAWLLCAASVPAADEKPIDPQLLKKFEARVFKDPAGLALNYRWFAPADYRSRTNVPLVVFLHGAAGLGDDNQRQFNGGNEVPPLALTADHAQQRFPSFVLAPQCPRGESWTGPGKHPARRIELLMALLKTLPREFPLDPQRIYLVGVSMGGNGVWDVAARFPDRFAAVVPICGSGDPRKAERLTRLPIWCFHGAEDPLIPVSYARSMIAAIREAGGRPRYTEYPKVGHDSYRRAFQEPELLPWLFRQRNSGQAR
jgi:predicted peptidase